MKTCALKIVTKTLCGLMKTVNVQLLKLASLLGMTNRRRKAIVKLKQISPCEAMKLMSYEQIGHIILLNNELVIMAEKKGWRKSYARDNEHQIQQPYCQA